MAATRRSPAKGLLDTKRTGTPVIALLVVALGAASGCYRSPTDVTVYDPGVYKGEPDPLVTTSSKAEHEAALRERFQRAATDR
jgi:hypothetical protein